MMSSTGIATAISHDRPASCRTAMITPPIASIGAEIISVAEHLHQHLHLLHVVGVAGDQRRRPELADLALREGDDAVEQVAAQITAHAHREPRAEVHGDDGAHDLHQADPEHRRAGRPDVRDVAGDHAVVDDVGVSVGSISDAIDCASWKTTTARMRGHAGLR